MQIKLEVDEKSPYGVSVGLRARVIQPPLMAIGPNSSGAMITMRPDIQAGKNGPIVTFEGSVRSNGPVIKHTEQYVVALVTTERDEAVLNTFYNDCIKKAAVGMQLGNLFANTKT